MHSVARLLSVASEPIAYRFVARTRRLHCCRRCANETYPLKIQQLQPDRLLPNSKQASNRFRTSLILNIKKNAMPKKANFNAVNNSFYLFSYLLFLLINYNQNIVDFCVD